MGEKDLNEVIEKVKKAYREMEQTQENFFACIRQDLQPYKQLTRDEWGAAFRSVCKQLSYLGASRSAKLRHQPLLPGLGKK